MGLKVSGDKDTIYFSNGIYIEHTRAYYKFAEQLLTVVSLRFLPRVLKILRNYIPADDKGRREIRVEWFDQIK